MAYLIPHNGLSCQQKDHDCKEWRQKYIAQCTRLEAAEKALMMARAVILNRADEALHEPLAKAYAEGMSEWRKVAGK